MSWPEARVRLGRTPALAWEIGGPGPALVVLHGFLGAPASWRPLVSRLRAPSRALAPALPGHAGAPARAEGTFDEALAPLVEELEASLAGETRPAWLVGYSLGARVAARLIATRPALFAGATLIGLHPGLEDEAARAERRALDLERADAILRDGLPAFVDSWEELSLFATQRALDAETLAGQRALRLAHEPAGVAASLSCLGLGAMPASAAALASCERPLDLVVGACDERFVALSRKLVSSMGSAGLHVVEGAGHNVALEAPAALGRLIDERCSR